MEFFNMSGNGEVHGQAETRGRTNQISDVRHQTSDICRLLVTSHQSSVISH